MANYEDSWCQEAYDRGFKEGREFEKENLTKAKEIIKGLLNIKKIAKDDKDYEVINKAEQFLKNNSCPDVMCEDCSKEDCGIKKLGLVEVEK